MSELLRAAGILCSDRVTDVSQALFALQLLSRVAGITTRTNRDLVLFLGPRLLWFIVLNVILFKSHKFLLSIEAYFIDPHIKRVTIDFIME